MLLRTSLRKHSRSSWRSAAFSGARIGLWLTMAYALVFAVYAVVRASLTIWAVLPGDEAWKMIPGTGVTIAFGILVFASVMSIISLVIGALAAVALKWLLMRFNSRHSARKALLIGLCMGIVCWLAGDIVLFSIPGSRLTPTYFETYAFWFVLPGAVFIAASLIVSRRLNALDR